jgi:putative transposase
LRCCRYIECNPVRARITAHPRDYRWSSYRFHADGLPDPLLSTHAEYERLGGAAAERQEAYQAFCGLDPTAEELEEIRSCLNHGWPLGGESFKDEMEKALHRPVRPSKRGRPPGPSK